MDGSAHEVTAYEITLGDYARYVQSRAEHYGQAGQDRRVLSWIRQPIERHKNEDTIYREPDEDNLNGNPEDNVPFSQQRLPVRHVSALQAVAYCVWASHRDGVPEAGMCFRLRDGLQGDNMTLLEAIERQLGGLTSPLVACDRYAHGYRPLYSDEWEHLFPVVNLEDSGSHALRHELGWHKGNSQSRIWPVGEKRPNSIGIFDTHGNVTEWCIASDEATHIQFESLGSSFASDLHETRPITPTIEIFGGHRAIGYRMIRKLD
jgi:formylglycine-generating enzyme required for sulfatase activity